MRLAVCYPPSPALPILFGTGFALSIGFTWEKPMGKSEGEEVVRLQGRRLIEPARRVLARLRPDGAERERAGTRKRFYDQYVGLFLLYFFTPTLTSLRALQNASNWEQTRRKLGVGRAPLGALSE